MAQARRGEVEDKAVLHRAVAVQEVCVPVSKSETRHGFGPWRRTPDAQRSPLTPLTLTLTLTLTLGAGAGRARGERLLHHKHTAIHLITNTRQYTW